MKWCEMFLGIFEGGCGCKLAPELLSQRKGAKALQLLWLVFHGLVRARLKGGKVPLK